MTLVYDIDRYMVNRWLMNINIILRCLIQNSTEDAILARWRDALLFTNSTRDESLSVYVSKMIE
jgi:hypothetical protein